MKIKQWLDLKFLALIPILFFFSSFQNTYAQSAHHRLVVADSLFKGKRYTQSFEQYQNILEQKEYSAAMLLKMAYIQEGLGHIGKAMYYLNLYFIASNDKSALNKMEQMAEKFHLEGYKATDADHALSFYHDHYAKMSILLVVPSIFMMSLIFYSKVKLHRKPIASGIVLVLVLAAFFFHINFGINMTEAIVSQSNTYVMKGPSAGAPVVAIIDEGNRVNVLGKKDVWLKIRWNDEIVYVKNSALLPVRL